MLMLLFGQLLVKGADNLLLNLYKTHIKDKPIVSTQKNTTTEEEIEDFNINNEELDEDELNNCFTLTQRKNDDGLTFTECANESWVYNLFHVYFYIVL